MIAPAARAVLAERQRPWAEAGWALAPEEARGWEQSGTAVLSPGFTRTPAVVGTPSECPGSWRG